MRTPFRLVLTLALLSSASILTLACLSKSRFPTCESDADCKAQDASHPYCTNLRCVECAYDRHCKDKGGACDLKNNTCFEIK